VELRHSAAASACGRTLCCSTSSFLHLDGFTVAERLRRRVHQPQGCAAFSTGDARRTGRASTLRRLEVPAKRSSPVRRLPLSRLSCSAQPLDHSPPGGDRGEWTFYGWADPAVAT